MMRNTIFRREFNVPLFPVSVTLIVAKNPALALRRQQTACKLYPDRDELKDAEIAALCWRYGSKIYVFFAPDQISHKIIAHELNHAAKEIFDFIEAKPTEEIYHYLIGFLTARVYRLIKKNKIRLYK